MVLAEQNVLIPIIILCVPIPNQIKESLMLPIPTWIKIKKFNWFRKIFWSARIYKRSEIFCDVNYFFIPIPMYINKNNWEALSEKVLEGVSKN